MPSKSVIKPFETKGLSRTFNKIFNLRNQFTIATIVLGSTLGTMNAAHALDGETNTIGANATITNTDQDDSSTSVLSSGSQDIILDEQNVIDSAVDITIDTIDVTDDNTAETLKILIGAKTFTVEETIVNKAGDTLLITLDDEGASTLDLQGAVTGVATNDIDFVAEATTTIKLSGDVLYSANFDGAGILQVTGTATADEQIGAGIAIGTLDIDGSLTSTGTIAVTNLDLDGTLGGATSLDVAGTAGLGGNMTTTNLLTIDGASTLTADTILTTTDSKITLTGAVNGTGIDLTANSGAAEVEITGIVGGSAVVGDISITGLLDLNANIKNGAAGGAASLTVSDAATLNGDVFTSGLISLEDVILESNQILNADDANITISGTLITDGGAADTIAIDAGTGNVTLSGAVGGTVLGTIALTGAEVNVASTVALGGALTVTHTGDSELTGIISGAHAVTKAGTGELTLRAVNTFSGDFTIEAGTVKLLGDLNAAIDIDDGGTLLIDKTIAADAVISATANDGVVASGAVIKMQQNLKGGEKIVWSDGADNAAQINALNAALVDNAIFDYVASDAGDDTHITAVAKGFNTIGTELGIDLNSSRAMAQALNAATNDDVVDATAEDAFGNALNALGGFTTADAKKLAKQVAPQTEVISGGTVAAKGVTNSVQGIISNRMASLRSGDAFATGMSAGSGMSAKSGFLQVFGSTAEQGSRTVGSGTAFGFDADSSGVAIGFDGISDSGTTVGLSLSMANTDLSGKGTGKASTDIDTYTASIYMDKATDNGYIEGSLTYGMSENTTSRSISAAGLNRVLSAAYDSEQVSLNVGAGMPNELSVGYLTPFASFTSTVISTDTYTEKSTVANDSLRLKVNQDDLTSMVGSVGVKYHNVMDNGGTPMISLAINNEFGDANIESANNYTGGGSVFNTQNAVEELSATLGVGYAFGNDYTSIEFAAEADANDDKYMSYGGSIKIVGKF